MQISFYQYKNKRKYKAEIRKIEKKEISMPKFFLVGKSPEKNPELKKIYKMIELGEIEKPIETKSLIITPEILEKLKSSNFNKIPPPYIHNIKTPFNKQIYKS